MTRMIVAVAVAMTAAFAPPADAKAPRADVAVAALKGVPAQLVPGGKLRLQATVRNVGRRRAGKSAVGVFLSSNRRFDRGDVRLGRAGVRALAPRKRRRATITASLPAPISSGRWHVIACADAGARVKEASERNNCRASAALTVVATAPSAALTAPPAPSAAAQPTPAPTAAPDPAPTPPRPGGPDPAAAPPAGDPLAVTPTLETATKSVKTIGPQGGTLAATAGDGTTYTLVVPRNALASEREITMTPLSEVGGLPFAGGLAAGVDLQPHGLTLAAPARLTFAPTSPVALADQAPFAYRGDGADLHLFPLTRDPQELAMDLLHFSGYGVAEGTDAEREAQRERIPADATAQQEQTLQELVEDRREGALTDAELQAAVLGHLRAAFDSTVKPRLVAAETDETLATTAISGYLAWARQAALLGVDASLAAETDFGGASIPKIITNAYDRSFQRCLDGDLAMAQVLVSIARSAQLLGMAVGDDVMERFARCARFELDYDVQLSFDHYETYPDGNTKHELTTFHVQALDVAIATQLSESGEPALKGAQDLSVLNYTYLQELSYPNSCEWVAGQATQLSGFAAEVQLDLAPRAGTDASGRTTYTLGNPNPRAILDLGKLSEEVKHCSGAYVISTDNDTYRESLSRLFKDQMVTPAHVGQVFRFATWTNAAAPLVGTVDVHPHDVVNGSNWTWTFDGDLRLDLAHVPQ